ncbi:MAG TPA: FKBP-type peptidyl-prolyl cis-trans isomerase [Candidatus Avibacteroides avistercoris]|uniref:Peptidyl-prolyl cis-trans isomerase n=1 Tax=Candidatus Avibacteroides avistercoris TaxID=2840690 RepID=A0A9D2ZUW4_9BACT|nr:FKBP-type peptidyl-prolyl cis-trans isomerase [Candidatus Avibacteroides avistercoris]
MDKFSYSLGLGIGQNLLSMGAKDLNVEDFSKAITDVLKGNQPEISHAEAKEIVNNYFVELQRKANNENIENGKILLERNKTNPAITTLPSGLQYEVLRQGSGRMPGKNDSVKCHYVGTFINGQVFDSSIARNEPAVFGVTQVIPGWTEALQLMHEGDKWRLYIPYDLAYGERGAGDAIPPYCTLIFEIELLQVI